MVVGSDRVGEFDVILKNITVLRVDMDFITLKTLE